jgi:hypothetical protein
MDGYQDGVNADPYGSDYKLVRPEVTRDRKPSIHVAPEAAGQREFIASIRTRGVSRSHFADEDGF